jgi:hypothetical protein
MAVSNTYGTKKAREWFNSAKNLPKPGNWSLGKIGRDKETEGQKYSLRVADPTNPKGPFLTVMIILITEDNGPKILEDYRGKYQHIWS